MTKNSTNVIQSTDIVAKRALYTQHFSSGTNFDNSFGMKIEILTLLAFLTQELNKRFPDNYTNAYDTLSKYIFNNGEFEPSGLTNYIIALSIICDDLMWGCNKIDKPDRYNSANEIRERIKEIINAWLPF